MFAIDHQDRVLLLTLERPEKRSALHPDMIQALSGALQETDADDVIRAVAITGAGRSFCAGLDLDHLSGSHEEGRVDYMRSAFGLFHQVDELRRTSEAFGLPATL